MSELIPWLTAALLKPALVIAAAATIAAGLRRHAAAARHAVWTGAILATLALPGLALWLPPLRVPLIADDAAPARGGRLAAPLDPDAASARLLTGERLEPAVLVEGTARPGTRRGPAVPIVGIWLAGILLLATRRAYAELRTRQIIRRAVAPAAGGRAARIFARECRALGVRRPPALLVTGEIPAPAAAGLFRPAVLLPAAAEQWGDADLYAALVHELGHVRRRDCLLDLITDLAAVVYWCNPALRLAIRQMRAESERACDDVALGRGAEPGAYARLLLAMVQKTTRAGGFPAAVTTMARPRQLEWRLLAVLDDRVARRPPRRRVAVALAASGLLLAFPAAAVTLQARPWTAQPSLPEPDQLADSVTAPASERLPSPSTFDVPPAALVALRGPDSALTARLIAALDRAPTDRSDLVRERAAWALGQADGGWLVEPLIAALGARDWRVQSYAAWALATTRDPRAVPPLLALLEHPVWRLRAMAAYALRESADRRAIRAMTQALTDPAWQVRLEAVGYFAVLGGPESVERVRARRNDRHVAVRRAARAASTP